MSHEIGWTHFGPVARAGAFVASLGIKPIAESVRRNKRKQLPMSMRAKVNKWIPDRGFGFCRTDDGQSVFIHVSELHGLESLPIGAEIEFEISPDNRNPSRFRATKVRVL